MLQRYRLWPNSWELTWKKKRKGGGCGFLFSFILFLALFGFLAYDTPSVFGYAVTSEVFATRQRKCFYAIAGTACWTETRLATMPLRYRSACLVGVCVYCVFLSLSLWLLFPAWGGVG
ncbi:hypothetical protein B0T19DRAFT_175465 [Cercophora scortea]|uniref:Uncharacterized protein n=1 Tax=Cercophora scortea TaxID=314031 RepID=A0AAE0IMV2_9PEZI|nr:hypothetical protein B0T19DRAFT_175465 [Cercophora scortea]